MPPPDLASCRLDASVAQDIFTTQILPADILPHPPSPYPTRPIALLTLGQTGAGKTRLVPILLSALHAQGRNPVHLIADVYKRFHPEYAALDPKIASAATGSDARLWLEMAASEVSLRRQDVVIESACRHPSDFTSLVRIFYRQGYTISVVILATPYALSRLGILVRFYEKLPEAASRGLPLRLTPAKIHDDSYRGLLEATAWLDEEKLVDRTILVRRGHLVAFVSERDRNGKIKGGVKDALERERQRPLTSAETAVAKAGLDGLERMPAAEGHIAELKKLLLPLLNIDNEQSLQSDYPVLYPLELQDEDNIVGLGAPGGK